LRKFHHAYHFQSSDHGPNYELGDFFTTLHLERFCMGKSTQVIDENMQLSKCAAWHIQHLGRCRHFKSETPGERWKLNHNLKSVPLNYDFFVGVQALKRESFQMMYGNIGVIFCETFISFKGTYVHCTMSLDKKNYLRI